MELLQLIAFGRDATFSDGSRENDRSMKTTLHGSRTERRATREPRANRSSCMPAKLLVALTLVLSLGLHWGFLQSVAWVGMFVSYSQDASFAEAWIKTFDGRHPCKLCTSIQKGQAEEKKQEQQRSQSGPKLEPAVLWDATELDFSCAREDNFLPIPCPAARSEQPPKPRPRGVFSTSRA